jgi:beta-galactosidase
LDKELLLQGLTPNFWRPLTDNDVANRLGVRSATWQHAGEEAVLSSLTTHSLPHQEQVVAVYDLAAQGAQLTISYRINPQGAIDINYQLHIGDTPLPELPKVGMYLVLKGEYDQMTWFGRGPHENYWDRKSSALIDLYKADVWSQFHPYIRPQETANKSDVRWVSLQNKAGQGIHIQGHQPLNVSAWNFPMDEISYVPFNIERRHGGSIQKQDLVWLNIDYLQMGVGGDNTWGAQTHPEYTISPIDRSYGFTIKLLR